MAQQETRQSGPIPWRAAVTCSVLWTALVAFISAAAYIIASLPADSYSVNGRPATPFEIAALPHLPILVGIAMVSAGVGLVLSSSSLDSRGKRRGALVVALIWHGAGAAVCTRWLSLSEPAAWTFAGLAVYECLGLAPIALAIPDGAVAARVRGAVWAMTVGAPLGAIGMGLAHLVSGPVPTTGPWSSWLTQGLAGGAVIGAVVSVTLAALAPGKPKAGLEGRHVRPAGPETTVTVCPHCGQRVEADAETCPYCLSPLPLQRKRSTGTALAALGVALIVLGATSSAVSSGAADLLGPSLAPTVKSVTAGIPLGAVSGVAISVGIVLTGIGLALYTPRSG